MNSPNYLVIFLFCFLSTLIFGQNTVGLECEKGFDKIKTKKKSQKYVSYKIISPEKINAKISIDSTQGIIVISDLNEKITPQEIIETVVRIGVKNKFSKVFAFRTCESMEIYFQQVSLTSEQENHLKNNLITIVDIKTEKILSKKEVKRYKRKRELIELVSKKVCKEFEYLNIEELSMEKLNQSIIKFSIDYTEKIDKVYGMSFEENTKSFFKDLTLHLIVDCELVNEFSKKHNKKSQ